MQPKITNGKVTFRMTKAENRRFRDVSYLASFAAGVLSGFEPDVSKSLFDAAIVILEFAKKFTPPPSSETNEVQDGETPSIVPSKKVAPFDMFPAGADPLNTEGAM
jgi:hypothetical protein